jgi:hypothetical protein
MISGVRSQTAAAEWATAMATFWWGRPLLNGKKTRIEVLTGGQVMSGTSGKSRPEPAGGGAGITARKQTLAPNRQFLQRSHAPSRDISFHPQAVLDGIVLACDHSSLFIIQARVRENYGVTRIGVETLGMPLTNTVSHADPAARPVTGPVVRLVLENAAVGSLCSQTCCALSSRCSIAIG